MRSRCARERGRLGLERVHFQKSDLLESLSERFGLIVANLPYIPMKIDFARAGSAARSRSALFGGRAGTSWCAIDRKAPSHLEPGGLLALELAPIR